jgi:xanthine dehydrogenase accessory factor
VEQLILRELVAALDRREAVALATVVATSRSVPRRAGSKMLVYRDGRTAGTIGGGEMEARVVAEACAALRDGRSRMLSYDLVDPRRGDPGVCGGEVTLYVEPHMPQPTAYVVGAGHIGRAVAHLAGWLGFRVVVTDDRAEEVARVEGADAALTGTVEEALAAEPVTEETAVIVVTRNAQLDAQILPALLATPARYVGVMGSERRWATTRELLVERGVTEEALDRVHNPIGVEVGAETPEEIAVSIMAEVIAAHRG